MRAERLLSIVLLLQRHQRLTATDLAAMLNVTERTIYRDIDALSLAGIPVYTKSGPDGGCFLDEHYRNHLSPFTGTEIQTLLYTGSASPLSELGMEQAMDQAILKLLSFLPKRAQQHADSMRQRLYLDPSGWYGNTEEHPALPTLKEAVWQDMWIDVIYENWEGHRRSQKLAPYSLVYKSDRWYLVARADQTDTIRTYRISRIHEVRLHNDNFERDSAFDIASYWQDASQNFIQRIPIYPVQLRVRPHLMIYFQNVLYGRYTIQETTDNWLIVDVRYTVFEEALSSVLGLGIDAEVIEPKSLHDAIITRAQALVDKYNTADISE